MLERLQEESTKPMRQNADGEKEIRPARNPPLAIGGQSATGNDTMQVQVMQAARTIP
jgi:hypothetical protein